MISEAWYRLTSQVLQRVLKLKVVLIAGIALCACVAVVPNAEALSARFQFAFGDDSDFKELGLPYLRAGLNVFLYDGEVLDVFIGGERAASEHKKVCIICGPQMSSSYKYNAAALGIHIKPFEKSRVNPYLTLGILSGSVKYHASFDSGDANVVSLSRDKASFTTYRTGLGLNIIIISRVALEVEANYSGGVPAAYATVVDDGVTSDRVMFDGSHIVTIAVGVRYYF